MPFPNSLKKQTKIFFLADDDDDDQDFFIEALHEIDKSIDCVTAKNGEEALQKLKTENSQPDFIFLDLNMPRINGKQCLAEIKKIFSLKDVPVIIYSTTSSNKDIEETKELGAAYFLTKPASFKELCDKIYYVLSLNWLKEKTQLQL